MLKIRFICFCVLLFVSLEVSSQSLTRYVVSVSGISSSENNGLISCTVGEPVIGSLVSSNNILTQGFQQPSLLLINPDRLYINSVEVFPNPVIKDLTILYNLRIPKFLFLDVYNSNSSMIASARYNVPEEGSIVFDMGSFSCGFYLLHIYTSDKLIDRIFKIEKF